ncbi:MAG: ATP-dependent zinc metalloprotease FtsH [Thermoguttaceae bacterium]
MSDPPQPTLPRTAPPRKNSSPWWLLLVLCLVLLVLYANRSGERRSEINYGLFHRQLLEKNIAKVDVQGVRVQGEFVAPPADPAGKKDPQGRPLHLEPKFTTTLPSYVDHELDDLLLAKLGDNYTVSEASDNTGMVLMVYVLVTVGLFLGLWFVFRRARDSFLGGGILGGFGKSPAKRYEQGDRPITFKDVAGLEGVKQELEEIVEFLKNPAKFQRLGGRVPKGVLLMGPPGTGKTLLGRAVAGEAGAPFYSVSGSEFIQMFVGVGASRVRDLFATAKQNCPCILFIDEIDAVGRHRGTGVGGGHDEREQTLNQILSEMDGFTQSESVIVMAATNRPDVLDPALLRPGRFDRHITVDRPSLKGRLAIFEVHTREVPLDADVDLERMAAGSVGLTGADIRNLVNEAALWASRHDKNCVDMADFEYARDKVLMGAKRDEVLTGKEKSMIAYHESGHVLMAWMAAGIDRVHKVTIIPRGRSLGSTQILADEDRMNISESELHTRLLCLLGGRAAEKLAYNELSAGDESDLSIATQLARRMVTHWGMSERLGPVAFRDGDEHPFLGREIAEPRRFSEHTAQVIDEEVSRILREASDRAGEMLRQHRDKLDTLARALEREETLDERAIEQLIGPPAFKAAQASGQ